MLAALVGLGLTTAQTSVAQMVADAANRYGVPAWLALAVAQHESSFNPSATNYNTNGTTDWGVMQLNDTTLQTLGISNPLDAQTNIDAGVSLLAKYLDQYNGSVTDTLWAYSAGPRSVAGRNMPSITQNFVAYVDSYSPPAGVDLGTSSSGLPSIDSPISSAGSSFDSVIGSAGEFFSQDVVLFGTDVPVWGIAAAGLGLLALLVAVSRG